MKRYLLVSVGLHRWCVVQSLDLRERERELCLNFFEMFWRIVCHWSCWFVGWDLLIETLSLIEALIDVLLQYVCFALSLLNEPKSAGDVWPTDKRTIKRLGHLLLGCWFVLDSSSSVSFLPHPVQWSFEDGRIHWGRTNIMSRKQTRRAKFSI